MVALWILFIFSAEPVSEIKLENFGRFLPDVSYNRVYLAKDNSFIATPRYQVWHWDENGKVINVFGAKGEGPGEFMFVGAVHWDGSHYWVIDSMNGKSSTFDEKGKFLKQFPLSYRQFVPVEDELFVLDYSRVNPSIGNYPTVLQKVEYTVTAQGDLDFRALPLRFKRVTAFQKEFAYNFKLVWVARKGSDYLVVDQLEPKARVYSPEAIIREENSGEGKPFQPKIMNLQARQWVEPIGFPKDGESEQVYLEWWWSWSRINYFANAGSGFILGYEKPDPEDSLSALQIVQRLDENGRGIGETLVVEGIILGVRNNQVYIFQEADADVGFSYWIRIYDF